MKAPTASISDSEWLVASTIWAEEGLTAVEVAARLEGRTVWKQKTVNTFLSRLVSKDVLRTQPEGRAFRYFSKVPRECCVRRESESFLKKVFGGAVAPMLAHFCETADLSDEELERLRKILNEKGNPRRKK